MDAVHEGRDAVKSTRNATKQDPVEDSLAGIHEFVQYSIIYPEDHPNEVLATSQDQDSDHEAG
jgi:hypothetical protein